MSVDAAPGVDGFDREQSVTPLELFFDLVFVFALTQVTAFLTTDLTWGGLLRGGALLAVIWWAWVSYSWLTNAIPAEEQLPARLVVLAAMAAMLVVALATPDAFGPAGVIFGIAYFAVRLLQVLLYALATDSETRDAILRLAPGFLVGPALLVPAGFSDGTLQAGLWLVALAVDYGVAYVRGVEGFSVQAAHFVERHRLVVIIALGESVVAIGLGIGGVALTPPVLLGALLGIVLVIALWWLYFDMVSPAAEHNLIRATGVERARLARDSYSYLHFPMVAGIVLVALGIEQTLAHVADPLGTIPALALGGGAALYLLGHNAFRFRDTRTVSVSRFAASGVAGMIVVVALAIPALISLALLTALFVLLVGYEMQTAAEFRATVRGAGRR